MSRTIKRMTAVLLSVILITTIFTALPFTASAEIINSGTTGYCTWTLDDEGTLTIRGSGIMGDYGSSGGPWGKQITNVIIEDGVKGIGSYAFSNCEKLNSITIPDSVWRINQYAFNFCTKLKSITIPDSVTNIGWGAFTRCTGLTGVYIHDLDAWCKISFGGRNSSTSAPTNTNPLYYAHNLYLNNELVTDLVIPDSVTSIDYLAFMGCTGLTSVTIPNSVTSIDESAFEYCKGLTRVTIPDSVTIINYKAFKNCTGLTSITIPDSVTRIYYDAFLNCTSLTSVTIPSAEEIGETAFGYYNENSVLQKLENFTIYGKEGTAAEQYAKENGFTFIPISDDPTEPTTAEPTTVEPTTAEPTTVEPTTEPAPVVMVGDVNGDNVVNGADAGVLNRYASGWTGYADKIKNWVAADINGDGNVNGADAGILARYTSGWKQYAKFFN